MNIPNGADLTEYLSVGQTVYYDFCIWDGEILKGEHHVKKVTAKQVVIEKPDRSKWTLDLRKVQTHLFLSEYDYKSYNLDCVVKEIEQTVLTLAELTTKRDAMIKELTMVQASP